MKISGKLVKLERHSLVTAFSCICFFFNSNPDWESSGTNPEATTLDNTGSATLSVAVQEAHHDAEVTNTNNLEIVAPSGVTEEPPRDAEAANADNPVTVALPSATGEPQQVEERVNMETDVWNP